VGSWLSSKTITYWGDIDTYGFVILNRLRARYPRVVSILMDAGTLLAHPDQWVVEEKPTEIALPHLTEAEAALYRDLVEDRYGHHVRLEQERIATAACGGAVLALRHKSWDYRTSVQSESEVRRVTADQTTTRLGPSHGPYDRQAADLHMTKSAFVADAAAGR
jgi:hypothetical protein